MVQKNIYDTINDVEKVSERLTILKKSIPFLAYPLSNWISLCLFKDFSQVASTKKSSVLYL